MAYDHKLQRRLVRYAGREFIEAGRAAERAAAGRPRLQAISGALAEAGGRIGHDGATDRDLALNTAIGAGCASLARAAANRDAAQMPRKTALGLVETLEGLRDDVLQDARSLAPAATLGPRASEERRLATRRRTQDAMTLGGDAAFVLHEAAGLVRHALGLTEEGGFEYPTLGGCGCGCASAPPGLRSGPRGPARGRGRDPGGADLHGPALAALWTGLDGFGALMAEYLVASGRVLALCTFFCDDLCAAAGAVSSAPVFKGADATNDGANWIPTFTVTWTMCCSCSCMKAWTRLEDTTFDVEYTAPGQVANTRPKAVAVAAAQKAGSAEVTNYNAANFPAPPAAGGAAKPPPAFVPNPKIKPGLNAVACPAKC